MRKGNEVILLAAVAADLLLHLAFKDLLSRHWFFDLTNHFRPYEVIGLVLIAGWCIFRLSRKAALVFFALTTAGLGLAHYQAQPAIHPAPGQGVGVQVISFNVYTDNQRKADVVKWIESSLASDRINLVFIMEADRKWISALRSLKTRLPYLIEHPREDNFGLALYSDVPLDDVRVKEFDSIGMPGIWGLIKNRSIRLAGVHAVPALAPDGLKLRTEYYQNLRAGLDAEKIPTLLFGDFNCTPWSANLKIATEGLNDSFGGLFRPHTWSPFGGLLSIPIDYVFYSPHFVLRSARVGPDLGSDHLPLVVSTELAM